MEGKIHRVRTAQRQHVWRWGRGRQWLTLPTGRNGVGAWTPHCRLQTAAPEDRLEHAQSKAGVMAGIDPDMLGWARTAVATLSAASDVALVTTPCTRDGSRSQQPRGPMFRCRKHGVQNSWTEVWGPSDPVWHQDPPAPLCSAQQVSCTHAPAWAPWAAGERVNLCLVAHTGLQGEDQGETQLSSRILESVEPGVGLDRQPPTTSNDSAKPRTWLSRHSGNDDPGPDQQFFL